MRFVVDAQLPPALARRLETLGHTAEHVADRGMASASDSAVRDYAARVGAVIVTKDEDFAIRRVLTDGPAMCGSDLATPDVPRCSRAWKPSCQPSSQHSIAVRRSSKSCDLEPTL